MVKHFKLKTYCSLHTERSWTALIHSLFTGKTGELTKTDSFDMWSGGKSVSRPHILFPFANFACCICIVLKFILGDHLTKAVRKQIKLNF